MATLTETAYFARKGVNLFVILLAVIMVLRLVVGGLFGIWQALFPPAPPPPTVSFGKLPYPNAQNSLATPSGGITFSLETVDGSLPVLPPSVRVYFMPRPGPAFGSYDRMKAQASRLGFTDIPKKTGSTAWRFTDASNPLRTLDVDEVSGNFREIYNYASDLSLFNSKNFTGQNQIVSDAQSFMDNLGLLSKDLKNGQPTVAFFRLDAGALVLTTSLSNADAVGVTFNRASIGSGDEKTGGLPVVSPDPSQGLVSILFSGANETKKKVLEARNFYTDVDLENFATYPLVKASEAYSVLTNGKAIVAILPTPVPKNVTIRKVYLAYLDPYPSQSYLQPVLVFSDEKGFIAYVPAVASEWLQ